MTRKEHSAVYHHNVGFEPPPVEIASEVEAIREQLQQALVLERKGHTEDSLAIAREVRIRTEQLTHRPVHAQALFQIARALDGMQTAAARGEAEGLYLEALAIAQDQRCDRLAAEIWSRLVQLALHMDSGPQQAFAWWSSAAAAPRGGGAYESAKLHHLRGEIYHREGKFAEAETEHELAIAAASNGCGQPELDIHRQLELSRYRGALARSLEPQGRIDEAVRLHEDALQIAGDVLGPSHPDVIKLRMNYGLALNKQGKLDRARAELEAALTSMPPGRRDASLDAGVLHQYLSEVSYYEGRLDDAVRHAHDGLRIYMAVGAPDHRRAEAHVNIGNAELKRKNFTEALARYNEALALRRPHLGRDHYQIGVNEGSLAEVLVGLSRHDEAIVHLNEAERIFGSGAVPDRACRAWILSVKGEVLVRQQQLSQAVLVLEHALPLFEGAPDPSNQAHATWARARALHGLHRDPDRVRQLAEAAGKLFTALGPSEARNRDAVEQFLAQLSAAAA